MTVTLVRGDAAHLPLPDSSVDLVVTSPPYFALRSYQDNGSHYPGQIGSEATPGEFIDALIACTREWVRVLKPAGSLWVNLGDKYNSAGSADRSYYDDRVSTRWRTSVQPRSKPGYGMPAKSLMGLPWRYALRCIDDLGLILRAEVIWSKPNGLPESVTDRVRRSHEQWFHMVKQPRYYAAVDTIREPQDYPNHGQLGKDPRGAKLIGMPDGHHDRPAVRALNPLGKLPGSVWSIPSQPLTVPPELGVDHFAAFPMEWPRRLILGWSPSGICTRCGEGRRPVVASQFNALRPEQANSRFLRDLDTDLRGGRTDGLHGPRRVPGERQVTVTGECCACTPYTDHPGSGESSGATYASSVNAGSYPPNFGAGSGTHDNLSGRPKTGPWREYHDWTPPPTRPAVVLDPFGGTGTTALMADVLGRHGISVDMSADYCRLAQWRTTDPGQRATAMQVDKPEAVPDGQLPLFA